MFNENDLVSIRCKTIYGNTLTWWRVMFIDNDNTFVGKLERFHKFIYTEHKIDDCVKFDIEQIIDIYEKGEQFCYSDNVTICTCEGLCRDKY